MPLSLTQSNSLLSMRSEMLPSARYSARTSRTRASRLGIEMGLYGWLSGQCLRHHPRNVYQPIRLEFFGFNARKRASISRIKGRLWVNTRNLFAGNMAWSKRSL